MDFIKDKLKFIKAISRWFMVLLFINKDNQRFMFINRNNTIDNLLKRRIAFIKE